jgi:hypothetical protein
MKQIAILSKLGDDNQRFHGDPPTNYNQKAVVEIFENIIEVNSEQGQDIKVYDNQYAKIKSSLDILWVIDDSGSMKGYIDQVSQKISIFLQQFLEKKIKFNMGLTSTSSHSSATVLTSELAQKKPQEFISKFSAMMNSLKSGGSGEERGVKAVLDYYKNLKSSSENNNKIIIIIVSDEDDSTTAYNNAEYYLSVKKCYEQIKIAVGKREFEIYSVVEFPPARTAGVRYGALSKATNGKVINIKNNFHQLLLNLGSKIISSELNIEETEQINNAL